MVSNALAQPGLVVGQRDARLDPPVQVGGERDVPEPGQSVGRFLDVVADAEDLLEHDDAGARARLGQRDVRVELAVAGPHALDSDRRRHGAKPTGCRGDLSSIR